MAAKKKTPAKKRAPRQEAPKNVARKFVRKGKATGLGQIPAQQFLWPTRWETLSIRRRDQQGKPLLLDNGDPAIGWQASFIVYRPDKSRSTIAVPPCQGIVSVETPLSKIEALALASCHQAMRNNGAQDGA